MKIKSLIFLFALMLFASATKAQNNVEWQPVLISMDGTNGFQGVDAYYSVSNCVSGDVVFLKLVNNNTYSVKAEWINAIQTKDGKELFGSQVLNKISIAPKSEVKGDCQAQGNTLTLKVNLADYGTKTSNFSTIVGSNFNVIKK